MQSRVLSFWGIEILSNSNLKVTSLQNVENKNYSEEVVERLKIKVTDFIVSQSTKDIDTYSKKFSSLL